MVTTRGMVREADGSLREWQDGEHMCPKGSEAVYVVLDGYRVLSVHETVRGAEEAARELNGPDAYGWPPNLLGERGGDDGH